MDERQMQLLSKLKAAAGASTRDESRVASTGDLFLPSALIANRMIDDLETKPARLIRAIATYVADPDNDVCGSATEFYNLAVEYRRNKVSDHRSALMVAERGLALHPKDPDLMSVAIGAASDCGDTKACERLIAEAESIGFALWSDSLFTQVIISLKDRLASDPGVGERALDYARAYAERYPFDDVAYNLQAELLLALGRTDEATAVLEKAIFGTQGPDANYQRPIVAPQCCTTYLEEVLSGEAGRAAYEKVIKIARKGVEYTAQDQPRASVGYFKYRDAEAQDALICMADDSKDGFGNENRVREALTAYKCAYRLLRGRSYQATIRDRFDILSICSGITDITLD